MMTGLKRAAAFCAAAIAALSGARAEPYTLFIYESAEQLAMRPAKAVGGEAYWQGYAVVGKAMADAGILRGGSALTTGEAVRQIKAGRAADSQTPFAAAPMELGGYFLIDVAREEEAEAWAKKIPIGNAGLVEIRAGYPVPGSM